MKLRHTMTVIALLAGSLACLGQSALPKWKTKALEQEAKTHSGLAEWELGMHAKGPSKAKEWFHKAVTDGFSNPLLEQRAGEYFVNMKNASEAQFWLELAVTHGNADAAEELSRLYSEGNVLQQNNIEAARYEMKYQQTSAVWLTLGSSLSTAESVREQSEQAAIDSEEQRRAERKQERLEMLNGILGAVNDAMTPPPPSTPQYSDPSPSVSSTSTEASAQSAQDQSSNTDENSSGASSEPETSTTQPGAADTTSSDPNTPYTQYNQNTQSPYTPSNNQTTNSNANSELSVQQQIDEQKKQLDEKVKACKQHWMCGCPSGALPPGSARKAC